MRATRLPWALFGLTCTCVAAYIALSAYPDFYLFSPQSISEGFPIVPIGVWLGGVLGALILVRHPQHLIGWLLAASGAGGALGFAANAYAYRALATPGFGPEAAVHWAAWFSRFFAVEYALAFYGALFLLAPDGRLLSRRWRPALWLLVASYLLWAGVLLIGVSPQRVWPDRIEATPLADGLFDLSTLLLILVILGGAVCLVLRLHRSTGIQRQQMRWIMASAVLLAVSLLALIGYQLGVAPGQPWYISLLLYVGYTSLPIFTGIAVLRYRLYDIDVIINRAVVLAVLTAFVTVGYVAVVVALGGALGSRVVGRPWPSLVALVVVALAFQPLRSRVQRFADRLVYGQRAAPYEALADFSRRLAHSRAPADLLPPLAEAVARSAGAAYARVFLDVPGTAGLSAAWPVGAERPSDVELDVRDRDEVLGRIEVSMPPGRGLRSPERRLLQDFAAQAGLAFHNLRLDAELRVRVEQLARQSADLAASRRRLLAARDDERQRIAAVIEREVLSHLRPIPAAVSSLDPRDVEAAEQSLDRLAAATGAGLDALREVTRDLFPVMLTRQGLASALRAHFERRGRAGVLSVAPALHGQRFPDRTEAAAYFCGVALLGQLAAADDSARLELAVQDGCLVLRATGGAEGREDGQSAIVDRVEAAGGRVSGGRDPSGRLSVRVDFPIPLDYGSAADAHAAASRSVPNADLAM
jgi:signal transduction histidine kinase